jgi:ABC-type protease/lipase transport system fused ATPase/permease subunit
MMVLTEGKIKAFGPRDEVLASLNPKKPAEPVEAQAPNGAAA